MCKTKKFVIHFRYHLESRLNFDANYKYDISMLLVPQQIQIDKLRYDTRSNSPSLFFSSQGACPSLVYA